MNMRRVTYFFVGVYFICLTLGFLGTNCILGAVGRAPVAWLGHQSSIDYMYVCSSYENYNKFWKHFWMVRGAEAGMPNFQRLYGNELFELNPIEGIKMLTQAADGQDYYAAARLSSIYEDPKYSFKSPEQAAKYKAIAAAIELKQAKEN